MHTQDLRQRLGSHFHFEIYGLTMLHSETLWLNITFFSWLKFYSITLVTNILGEKQNSVYAKLLYIYNKHLRIK